MNPNLRWPPKNSRPKKVFKAWLTFSAKTLSQRAKPNGAGTFSNMKTANPYFGVLEIRSELVLPPSEFEVAFDEAIKEIFGPDPDGDEIVPHKLAKLFFPIAQDASQLVS